MEENTYTWLDKNRLTLGNGYTLYCSGAFRFALDDKSKNQIEFAVVFDPETTPPSAQVLMHPKNEWDNSKEKISKETFSELLEIIAKGFWERGYSAKIALLDNSKNLEYYAPTLNLLSAILGTEGGARLEELSVNADLSDSERNILWGEAIIEFLKANSEKEESNIN